MNKVKITVLKTTLDEELAREYGAEGLTACPMMKAGQVFYADYAKPEELCDEAWKAIYQYVFALAHGTGDNLFYFGDWIREPGVAICSCNDGLRPVIFKLEATDEKLTKHRTTAGWNGWPWGLPLLPGVQTSLLNDGAEALEIFTAVPNQ